MTSGLRGNHIYDHIGTTSKRLDDSSGETLMPITDDVRTEVGLRAAPLGLAFEQGVATYVFDRALAVPSQISLHVRDRGEGLQGIRSVTHAVRFGRTAITTDGEIFDADDPTRLVAYGSIAWSVIGEAPVRAAASEDAPERPPFEPAGVDVAIAAGITRTSDGGCRVESVTPQTAGPGGILHAGVLQLLSEEAALVAAKSSTGRAGYAVDCTYNFLQPGKVGPFVATAEVLSVGDEGVDTKVKVHDEGNDNRILALAFVRVRPV
jgi:uncharacterized protein (TIGR00369 family)